MKNKALCSFLVVLIALTLCASVLAEDVIVPYRASEIISAYSASITSSGGYVYVGISITGEVRCDQIGISKARIQENRNGSWVTVKTVYSKYSYDSYSKTYSMSYDAVVGNEYRAVVNYYAKDGDISDTATLTSSTKVAR